MSKRKKVALLTPFISGYYLGEITDYLREYVVECEIDLILVKTRNFGQYNLPLLLNKVDGIIILINAVSQQYVKEIVELNIPVISIGIDFFPAPIEHVLIDNRDGIFQAMDHLVELGHTHIGYCGDVSVHDFNERYTGYLEYKKRYNLPHARSHVFDMGNNSINSGSDVANEFIRRANPCSAMIFATDLNAVGFQDAILSFGYKVPDDIAIIGFDNSSLCRYKTPQLTSIDQRVRDMSITALNRLWDKMLDNSSDFINPVQKCTLVVRGSTTGEDYYEQTKTEEPKISKEILENLLNYNYESIKNLRLETGKKVENIEHSFGNFFKWAYLARWKDVERNKKLILEKFYYTKIENLTYNSFLGKEIDAKDFPMNNFFNPTEYPNSMISLIPLNFRGREWGVLAVAGDVINQDRLISYHLFGQYLDLVSEKLEKEIILDNIIEKELETRTLSDELKVISNSATDGIWMWDLHINQFEWNDQALTMLGFTDQIDIKSIKHKPIYELVHEQEMDTVKARLQKLLNCGETFHMEFRLQNNYNDFVWVKSTAETICSEDGTPERVIGSISDISEKQKHRETIKYMTSYDFLTELPNREMCRHHLHSQILQNNTVSVIFLDLDRFKVVNDSYGHDAGDRLLQHSTAEISSVLRGNDFFGRMGGDEFLIISPVDHINESQEISKRVMETLNKSYKDDSGFEFYITCSMGIALFPNHGSTSQNIIKNAEIAMYQAKKLGRNRSIVYQEVMDSHITGKLNMEAMLRKSLKDFSFMIHIQPQYYMKTGKLSGGEILLRWFIDGVGFISPAEFIPLAEELNLMDTLGKWVLQETCKIIKSINSYKQKINFSINISASELHNPLFFNNIEKEINSLDSNNCSLTIEITESMAISDIQQTVKILNRLRGLGIRTSLDDFGTGFSSLSVFKELPLDELKIDKSFLPDSQNNSKDWAIIESIIKMGQALGLEVVTEGIESAEQQEVLTEIGCDIAQGYHYGRPMPVEDFKELLK